MFKKSKSNTTSYGIVGIGRFGYALAIELAKEGNDILIIDCDEEKVAELREYTENAFVVKNIDKKSLQSTGIQNCDVAVVCIGEQLDTSILTTLNLVSMGIPHVISKAKSAEHGEILEKLGAEVVYPERDMAIRLANRLITSSVIDFVQLSEQINVSKMKIPDNAIGKSVIDLNLRSRFNLNIIAIEKSGVVSNTVDPHYYIYVADVTVSLSFLTGFTNNIIFNLLCCFTKAFEFFFTYIFAEYFVSHSKYIYYIFGFFPTVICK